MWLPSCQVYVHVYVHIRMVTGQLADSPTRGLPTRGLDKSRTGQLAVSRMAKKTRKLRTQSRRWHPRVVQSATCPVRELSSPRDVQSASWQSASWRIRELSSNRYNCPVYDCPDVDCVIKTCYHGTAAPTFWPMSIVMKQLDGSTCHMVWTMEVRVGPDHIVSMGTQLPHKGHSSPLNFSRCLLWPNGWMDQNASIPNKFCTVLKTTKCPSWVVQIHT